MTQPQVDWLTGYGKFLFEDEGITADISRIYEHKDSASCEVIFRTASNGTAGKHLHQTRLNLLSSKSKTELANFMGKSFELPAKVNWKDAVELISVLTLRHMREGEAVEEIWTDAEIKPPSYLIYPIIAKNQPSIIFGPGGSGKSEMALLLGMIAQLPMIDNPFGLKVTDEMTNVLYIDYETESDEIKWRAKQLRNGLAVPHFSIKYLRGTSPLPACIEQIQRKVIDNDIGFVIVDSLAPACGAQDLNPSTGAQTYFEAIRSLRTTSLTLAHSSKPTADNKEATIYGSVFFTNLCRSVWECKSSQEDGADYIDLALFHRKVNLSKKFQPQGFRITFGSDGTHVRTQAVSDVPELEEQLPAVRRIRNLLKTRTKASLDAIAEALNIDKKKLSPRLTELQKRGIVKHILGEWYLVDNIHSQAD